MALIKRAAFDLKEHNGSIQIYHAGEFVGWVNAIENGVIIARLVRGGKSGVDETQASQQPPENP